MQAIYLQQLRKREYDPKTGKNPFVFSYRVTKTINRITPRIGEDLSEHKVSFFLDEANSNVRDNLNTVVIEKSPRFYLPLNEELES